MNYPWAVNKLKLGRAIQASKTKAEDDIRERYIKLAGLVRNDVSVETPVIEEVEPSVVAEEKPKAKRGRKPKNVG